MQRAPSPARLYFAFVLVLAGAMLFAAIASPWVQSLLSPHETFPLHRIFHRLTLFGWIAGAAWLLIREKLANRSVLGFVGPRRIFVRRLGLGLAAGLGLMVLALVPLFVLGLRTWNAQWLADHPALALLICKGLGVGLLVAVVEETFFRGAMQGALQRAGSTGWALFAVPLLYSAVHFLGGEGSRPDEVVGAWSGFVVWGDLFHSFVQPLQMLDAFLALYFVGLLLALVRRRWGDLAGCIGLHAGFVGVITVCRRASEASSESAWSFLVGPFDGLLGIWIAAATALLCLMLWRRGGPA